jgi:uncharacterized lipoprotein
LVKQLIAVALLVVAIAACGCDQQVGPKDKTVSGTEYKDLVNKGVPEGANQDTAIRADGSQGAGKGK